MDPWTSFVDDLAQAAAGAAAALRDGLDARATEPAPPLHTPNDAPHARETPAHAADSAPPAPARLEVRVAPVSVDAAFLHDQLIPALERAVQQGTFRPQRR